MIFASCYSENGVSEQKRIHTSESSQERGLQGLVLFYVHIF